jgi:hypothetical protein
MYVPRFTVTSLSVIVLPPPVGSVTLMVIVFPARPDKGETEVTAGVKVGSR